MIVAIIVRMLRFILHDLICYFKVARLDQYCTVDSGHGADKPADRQAEERHSVARTWSDLKLCLETKVCVCVQNSNQLFVKSVF